MRGVGGNLNYKVTCYLHRRHEERATGMLWLLSFPASSGWVGGVAWPASLLVIHLSFLPVDTRWARCGAGPWDSPSGVRVREDDSFSPSPADCLRGWAWLNSCRTVPLHHPGATFLCRVPTSLPLSLITALGRATR